MAFSLKSITNTLLLLHINITQLPYIPICLQHLFDLHRKLKSSYKTLQQNVKPHRCNHLRTT